MSNINAKRQICLVEAGKIILVASFCLLSFACRQVPKTVQAEPQTGAADIYEPARIVGSIKNRSLNESSGLVASRTFPGAFWTHNDSGGGPFIYAINIRGESLGVWRVTGAESDDWEDISIGPGSGPGKTYLYIGDIGDNDFTRKDIVVYRVPEPKPNAADVKSTKANPLSTEQAEAIRLRYPDGRHDAEALLVHPTNGNLYIVTKVAMGNPSVYEASAPLVADKTITLKSLGELKIRSLFGGIITGGSISPDGKRIALCDYFQGYEVVLPPNKVDFDEIWKQPLLSFKFGQRKQGESIAYRLDGRGLLGTSEGRGAEVIEVVRK